MSNKIRSRFLELGDTYAFSGPVTVPDPALGGNASNKDYVDSNIAQVSVFRAEDLQFTDTVHKVIALNQMIRSYKEVVLIAVDGNALDYGEDYTVRTAGTNAYVCLSPSSSSPTIPFDGGGDGLNPTTGMDSIVSNGDEFKIFYASAGFGNGGSSSGGGGNPDSLLAIAISANGFTIDPQGNEIIALTFDATPRTSSVSTAIVAGQTIGERLFIYVTGANQTFTIKNNALTKLNGDWNGGASLGSVLSTDVIWLYLIWDGTFWRELSRSEARGTTQSGTNAHAEGNRTTASAESAHSEGYNTLASGAASHAEGNSSHATAAGAHAEGTNNVASAANAHSEGNTTKANGANAHSEGNDTLAQGTNSHAEGNSNQALAQGTHAEGSTNVAVSDFSHVEGNNNVATGGGSHVEGQFNRTGTLARAFTVSGTSVTIAGGDYTSEFFNGDTVALYNLTGGSLNTLNFSSQVISNVQFNSGPNNTTFDITSTPSDRTGGEVVDVFFGNFSHAEGFGTVAQGSSAHAEGMFTQAINAGTHVEGFQTLASGQYGHAEGFQSAATASAAHAEGNATRAQAANAHAEGDTSYANGAASHAEGSHNTSQGDNSHAEGQNTTSAGQQSHAEGFASRALGDNSHSEGNTSYAYGANSHVEGNVCNTFVDDAHAEGNSSDVAGPQGHAEGSTTFASSFGGHSEGIATVAGFTPQQFTYVGLSPENDNISSTIQIVGGDFTSFYPSGATVYLFNLVGNVTKQITSTVDASFPPSFDGINTTTINLLNDNLGFLLITNGSIFSSAMELFGAAHAEGSFSIASGDSAHAEGNGTNANGNNSHAEGCQSIASGKHAHAEGQGTQASLDASHAEGFNTQANALYAHAEGQGTLVGNPLRPATFSGSGGSFSITIAGGDYTSEYYANNTIFISQMLGVFPTANYLIASVTFNGTDTVISFFSLLASPFGGATSGMVVDPFVPPSVAPPVSNAGHAEGYFTTAIGAYSHSEGELTIAGGKQSHAEGYGGVAAGPQSHTEGLFTIAAGNSSHAEGCQSYATGRHCHAEGQSNVSGMPLRTFTKSVGSTTLTVVGGDYTSEFVGGLKAVCYLLSGGNSPLQEAINISSSFFNGTDTVVNFSTDLTTHIGDRTDGNISVASAVSGAHAEGIGTSASADGAHAEGFQSVASGLYAHAQGQDTIASQQGSHAEGMTTQAEGVNSHAEGQLTQTLNTAAHAEGTSTIAEGMSSHAEGTSTTAFGTSSHSEGDSTLASGDMSHAEGSGSQANAVSAHAEGFQSTANGLYSHSENMNTVAIGNGSHAEGFQSLASGVFSHVEGFQSIASGDYSHAEGRQTIASGESTHTEGFATTASFQYAHAEGQNTQANGPASHAEGQNGIANGANSHVEGQSTLTQDVNAHAEGVSTKALSAQAHSEGDSTVASGIDSHAEGFQSYASGDYSHAEGQLTATVGNESHAEGLNTKSNSIASHAEGNATLTGNVARACTLNLFTVTIAGGNFTSEFPNGATVSLFNLTGGSGISLDIYQTTRVVANVTYNSGPNNTTFTYAFPGNNVGNRTNGFVVNTSAGQYSHAEGNGTIAKGSASHAEGLSTLASGAEAHAEGNATTASGDWSHVEGYLSTASGLVAHAEGQNTRASGYNSHAEGNPSHADGVSSHAEGAANAYADYSHAEGNASSAIGGASHSENTAIASGEISHAEGGSSRTGNPVRAFTVSGTTVTIAGGNFTSEFTNGNNTRFFELTGGTNNTTFKADKTISAVTFNSGPNNTTFTINSVLDDRTGGMCVDTLAGSYAHAQGNATVATGSASHAEGNGTTASGANSHAQGLNTVASGANSHASGDSALASLYAQRALSSNKFSVAGDAQISDLVLSASTANASPLEAFINGSNRLVMKDNQCWAFTLSILGKRLTVNETAFFKIEGLIYRGTGAASVVLVNSAKTTIANNSGAWDVNVSADTTNGSLKIAVTGEASKNIQWVIRAALTEVIG